MPISIRLSQIVKFAGLVMNIQQKCVSWRRLQSTMSCCGCYIGRPVTLQAYGTGGRTKTRSKQRTHARTHAHTHAPRKTNGQKEQGSREEARETARTREAREEARQAKTKVGRDPTAVSTHRHPRSDGIPELVVETFPHRPTVRDLYVRLPQ